MSNPTTPFSWQMPTATDLVTDLPADFEVFGQAVATSMGDLLGGTTGQILSKATNTDMDFVWIANDQGDITGITASSPLTGGGTSGAITVGIQDALTTQKGAVQLSDSTSTTSSILAATPTAVKSAYDLANGAIPKSLIDAAGDLIVGTAADTAGRLAIGTNGQVLQSNGTTAVWATPAAAGTGPAFRAFRNTSDQSIASTTAVKVQLNAETFDTDSCFDPTTNYRFTPTTAGYYLITANIGLISGGSGYGTAFIYKNGSRVSAGRVAIYETGSKNPQVSDIIYFNGSTDYVELYTLNNGATASVAAGTDETWLTGAFIKS